jgi:hypothetical protein
MVGDTHIDRRLAAAAGIGRFIWAADYFGTMRPDGRGLDPDPRVRV